MNAALTPRIAVMLTVPPVLWAGNAVVGRLLVGTVPPLTLSALRWSLALLVLLPLGWRAFKRFDDIASRWKYLGMLGVLGIGSYNALQYYALQTSTPINVTLILSSLPLWMLALGFFLYGERPTRMQALGAVLSLVGVLLVLSRGDMAVLHGLRLLPGDVLMLIAVALWAGYSWLLARPPVSMQGDARPKWNWAEFLLLQVAIGAVFGSALAGVEAALNPATVQWSPQVMVALAYLVIGPSVLAYWCWGTGVATVGPAIAAFFSNLTPVFAAVMSAALLGEPPRWYHIGAFVLIAAGIVVTSWGRSNGPRS
jgi:drug/metabolite transporter (DMT)-like permease